MLSAKRLHELLNYSPDTGVFTRRVRTSQGNRAGDVAGGPHNAGYWNISVDGRRYLAHRLAWLYVHGEWPPSEIDHIDGNRNNNQIANLRIASRSLNQQNRTRPTKHNQLGVLGVYYSKRRGRFVASLRNEGRNVHVGEFATAAEAHDAYVSTKRVLHSGCTL